MPNLEEVFKLSGVPTYTFVEPVRYEQMKVSIRTPGRCLIVEGPSGIGKTTCVSRIIDELGMTSAVTKLSARRPADLEYIEALPDMRDVGVVMIDDFHRLEDSTKIRLSDYVKILADEGLDHSKIILIGINKAGDRLVQYGADVGLRIDVFRMEANPPELVEKLIGLGEAALNVTLTDRAKIRDASQGSFQLVQMLCHEVCVEGKATETQEQHLEIGIGLSVVMDAVIERLRQIFQRPCTEFAQGSKLRKEGRAPYLHILRWLVESKDWTVDLRRSLKDHPEHRGSVGQVVTKGYLETLLRDKAEHLDSVFHYQPETNIFTVEDPRVVFYLRNINWVNFVKEVGFSTATFSVPYDVALSFAGPDRDLAEELFSALTAREISVFYDKDEQHLILAENVEDYLAPIYAAAAVYVVPLLSSDYPARIWTRFESKQFRDRFGQNAVIPIRFTDTRDGYFSEAHEYGSLSYDPAGDRASQVSEIAEIIARRLETDRFSQEVSAEVKAEDAEAIAAVEALVADLGES